MLQFIEYPKCSTCRKAKAELIQLGLDFEAVDIVKETPSQEELLQWMTNSDLEIKSFFNTSGIKYRELGLKDKVPQFSAEEAAELLPLLPSKPYRYSFDVSAIYPTPIIAMGILSLFFVLNYTFIYNGLVLAIIIGVLSALFVKYLFDFVFPKPLDEDAGEDIGE